MNKMQNLYRQVIMDHYKNPRNKGLVDDAGYKSVHIKNPSCGDDITVQSKIEDGIVKDVRHEGTGCSICCSSASVMSDIMKNKTVEEAVLISDNFTKMLSNQPYDEQVDLDEAIVYEGVRQFPARVKCASLAWKAFVGTTKESE
jgi:SUF system NifU family Fe-S assembly protein